MNNEMNATGTQRASWDCIKNPNGPGCNPQKVNRASSFAPQKASWDCIKNPNGPGCNPTKARSVVSSSAEGELLDIGSGSAIQEEKMSTPTPAWAYILPIIGMLGAGYYAHKKGGNYGKIALFAITGAWALSAPTMYYMSKGVQDSLTPKK